jgi:two-component system OmpR family sensor kinase
MRTRLIAILMTLLAAVSLVIVFMTTWVLHGYLLDQVDGRLQAAAQRPAQIPAGGQPPPPPSYGGLKGLPPDGAPSFLLTLGQADGTIGAEVAGGEVLAAAYIDTAGALRSLSAEAMRTLAQAPADRREPYTVSLGELGDYRLLAVTGPDGTTRVTGLPLGDANATLVQLTLVAGVVAAVGTAAAGVIGAMTIRRTLWPLHRVAVTASHVAQLPLDRGEVALPVRIPGAETDPRTEVGQVSIAIERLLGHVEAALSARHASETRVRQFLADASHELRTPLAAISGYAELTRRSHETVPADVAHAMRRVESESARMTALVEDMLLLARLDAGRPLAHEPVDLSRLVVDAANDAHVASPAHQWELALPDEPVTVVGDAARLHQVLANLLANARTHTPPGTRVTLGLAAYGGCGVHGGDGYASGGHGGGGHGGSGGTYGGGYASGGYASGGHGGGGHGGSGGTYGGGGGRGGGDGGHGGGGGHGVDGAGRRQGVGTGCGEAVVSVIDDGPGIPPALLPNVFERFARGDTSRSRAAGSTGLGLAIVAAVVEAHEGRVDVTSVAGRTAFTVRLPLAQPIGLDPAHDDPAHDDPAHDDPAHDPVRDGPSPRQGQRMTTTQSDSTSAPSTELDVGPVDRDS